MLLVADNKCCKSGSPSLSTEVETAIMKILQFESIAVSFERERLDDCILSYNLSIFELSISKPTVRYFSLKAMAKGRPILPNPITAIWGDCTFTNSSNQI